MMGLPLPKVVPDTPQGGNVLAVMNAGNDYSQGLSNNKIKASEARYAPYTNYADVMSKLAYANYLPYQLQAQVMSNPLLWMSMKDNPEAMQAMMKNFTGSIPSVNKMPGMAGVPQPGAQGNSLLRGVLAKLFGGGGESGGGGGNAMQSLPAPDGGQSSNALMTPPGGSGSAPTTSGANLPNPGVPATGGAVNAVAGKETAPYNKQPYGLGENYADPNHPGQTNTTATGQITDQAQNMALATENLKPLFRTIIDGAPRWLKPGAKGQMALGQRLGGLEQMFGTLGGIPDGIRKQFGIKEGDISDYAEWKSAQTKALETIVKARGWNNSDYATHKVEEIIAPLPGEGKEYGARIQRDLDQLTNELVPNSSKAMTNGFPLTPAASSAAPAVSQAVTPAPQALPPGAIPLKTQAAPAAAPAQDDGLMHFDIRTPQEKADEESNASGSEDFTVNAKPEKTKPEKTKPEKKKESKGVVQHTLWEMKNGYPVQVA